MEVTISPPNIIGMGMSYKVWKMGPCSAKSANRLPFLPPPFLSLYPFLICSTSLSEEAAAAAVPPLYRSTAQKSTPQT